ncbi:hypothetical protein B0H13DRAFT_2007884 [Mycena leptocephala]|nr:hypothetical protein B0H13DRAFT_2007884 [Mycena leptocephala]
MEMKAQGVTYSPLASGHAYGLPSPIPPSLSPSSLDAAGAKTEAEARHSTLPPLRNTESRCISRFPLDEWVALPFHSPPPRRAAHTSPRLSFPPSTHCTLPSASVACCTSHPPPMVWMDLDAWDELAHHCRRPPRLRPGGKMGRCGGYGLEGWPASGGIPVGGGEGGGSASVRRGIQRT